MCHAYVTCHLTIKGSEQVLLMPEFILNESYVHLKQELVSGNASYEPVRFS
jgi:hypothetical protein